MALEALSSSELLNFIIYDTMICSTPPFSACNDSSDFLNIDNNNNNALKPPQDIPPPPPSSSMHGGPAQNHRCRSSEPILSHQQKQQQNNLEVQGGGGGGGRKKRRRRQRVCKNKEEAETQRMTHIAVERNRRKQMNEHLAVLRSLMPESYVQRGDQASIVGGAIEFVKELEHHLQSLEAQKFLLLQQNQNQNQSGSAKDKFSPPTNYTISPFAQFFSYPQYSCSSSGGQFPNKYTAKSKAAIADIEVTLIETHANVRILSRRRLRQLSKMVTGFHTLHLTILHLNVTTLDPLVLYSISAKVEEGCLMNSADDIAGAVHHMLRIIEEEANLGCEESSLGLTPTS